MRQFSNDNEHDEDMAGVLSMPSGLLVTHLTAGEQFILWAFRHRRADDSPGSRCILHGFRLAFGLAKVEAGLAVFESLWALLGTRAILPLRLAPLRASAVLRDERRLLDLHAAAQAGDTARTARIARGLVEAEFVPQLCAYAETMAELLAHRDWRLGDPGAEREAMWDAPRGLMN
jgi:hypothetical protein